MNRPSYATGKKEKLIALIAARTGTPRSELTARSLPELEQLLSENLMAQVRAETAQVAEAADEELIRIQAESEAARVPHQLQTQQAQASQRSTVRKLA